MLGKKLRQRLGYDPIDSKRFLGYCIELDVRKLEDARKPDADALSTFHQAA